MSHQADHSEPYYMRRLVDHVPSMLAYWDKDLRCRFANRAYKTWFGVDPDKLIGSPMQELLGPTLFEMNKPHIMAALRGEEQTFERVVPGPNGVQRHSLANYVPDIVNGQVLGFLVQVTEVTKLKQVEAALRASEAFMERTGRIARVGGWELDLQTNTRIWSDQTCRIFGLPPGHRPTQEESRRFVAPDALPLLDAAVQTSIEQGTPWDMEVPAVTIRGEQIWIRTLGEVQFEKGKPVRLSGAIQDITEQVHNRAELAREQAMRAQLERQAAELHALLAERSDMLDVLAHEVRQPLHNASAALQSAQAALTMVDEQVATPRLVRAQAVMTQVMASLDNTLAVAALLASSAPIRMDDTDIDTMVAVAVADMPASDRPRIIIQRDTSTRTASMDMSLMRLALRNLLANALKYSLPNTPIIVKLYDSDEPLALVIDVENTGPSVPQELEPIMFERGSRGQHPHSVSGLGLGLYIVKRVMELHGGRVALARNTPAGVTMRLVLNQASA